MLAGVDAHHGWRGFPGWGAQAARRAMGGITAFGLQQGQSLLCGRCVSEPLRFECGHDEPGRQQNGDGLGEEKPVASHVGIVHQLMQGRACVTI